MLRKNPDLPVLRDLKTAVMRSLMFRFLAGTVPGKAKLLKNMGIIDGLSLQALASGPFRLTPRNSTFRGFLMPVNGLCKMGEVQMNALECTKWHEYLPEPCRRQGSFEAWRTRKSYGCDGNCSLSPVVWYF